MIAKQGHGDGFCGIYCLINALRKVDGPVKGLAKVQEDFRRLVMSADRLGLLDAYHIIEGYEDFELVEIFNLTARNFDIPFVATKISYVLKDLRNGPNQDGIRCIISWAGSVIVRADENEHWVLAHTLDNDQNILGIDPWPGKSRLLLNKISTTYGGVAIVPIGSELAKSACAQKS